jgi:FkbM family methyltransferase
MTRKFSDIPELVPRGGTPARMLYDQHYEWMDLCYMMDNINPGDTILDVGGDVGYWSLVAAKHLNNAADIFCFEPTPSQAEIIRGYAKDNNALFNLYEGAILDHEGEIDFWLCTRGNHDNRAYKPETNWADGQDIQIIKRPCTTLDSYIGKDNWHKVSFIKIDVQGAEPAVLRGAENIIASRDKLNMIIELWPDGFKNAGEDVGNFLDWLVARKFRLIQFVDHASSMETGYITEEVGKKQLMEIARRKSFMNFICSKG